MELGKENREINKGSTGSEERARLCWHGQLRHFVWCPESPYSLKTPHSVSTLWGQSVWSHTPPLSGLFGFFVVVAVVEVFSFWEMCQWKNCEKVCDVQGLTRHSHPQPDYSVTSSKLPAKVDYVMGPVSTALSVDSSVPALGRLFDR